LFLGKSKEERKEQARKASKEERKEEAAGTGWWRVDLLEAQQGILSQTFSSPPYPLSSPPLFSPLKAKKGK
jgi:hypothetical protein